jgi:elongation factor Ts
VDQVFVKNSDITIGQLITNLTASTGEKITLRRFTRFEVGEGLTKRVHDIAAEVAEITGE